MMRRCFAPTAVLAASLVLGLSAETKQAQASTINPNATTALANYRLTASAGLPVPNADIAGPQVVAMVVPAGGVVPPINADGTQGSPLTILSDSTGFDADQLVVALKDATSSTGTPEQLLGLVFFGQGLQPGGVLHFALSIDKALAGNPPTLVSSTPGITITVEPATTDPGAGGDPDKDPTVNVPEPVAFMLWSAVASLIALRARAMQRARMGAQTQPRI